MIDVAPIAALCGSQGRFRLVRTLFGQPARAFHLRALAGAAEVDPAQAHRQLRDMVRAGLCDEVLEDGTRRYRAARGYPLAEALAQTFAGAGDAAMVELDEAPVLQSLLWTGRERKSIPEDEAFRHYENNWAYVRGAGMGAREKRLLERLVRRYGRGVVNA